MNTKMKNTKEKEKGQALLFVVVAVTIALSVGVSVSTRTLSSQKRVASSDTAIRVANAAEGGAEMMLGQSYSFLASFTPGPPNCASVGLTLEGASCVLTYLPTSKDNITTKASVNAVGFSMNTSDHYWFDLSPGMVKDVRLVGYSDSGWSGSNHGIYVCWENPKAAIYTLSYNSSGNIKKEWFVSNHFTNTSNTSGFSITSQNNGHAKYTACASIHLVSSPYGLRIKTLYDSTRIHVYPGTNGSFPTQGYKIISKGELVSGGGGDVKETRVVAVYKSFPYAASIIDSGLYSAGGGIN